MSQTKDYAVEVAALRSQECAVELANGLVARGFEAYLVKANQPEHGIYYRVRVGRFQKLDVARSYAENLLDSGLLDTCAITFYEAPLSSIIKSSSLDQKNLQASLAGLPLNDSCPIKLPEDNSGGSVESPEDLIGAIGKSKWLLSASKSVVYTLPARKPSSPEIDIIVLLRAIDKNRWRLINDVGQLMASTTPTTVSSAVPSTASSAQPNRPPASAIDSTMASSLSSLKIGLNSATAAVNSSIDGSVPDSSQIPAAQPNRPPASAIDSTMASSLSSLKVGLNSATAAVNTSVNNSVPSSSQILAAATTPVSNAGPNSRMRSISEIDKTDPVTAVRNLGYFAPPKLQGAIEMREGQLMMRIRNLDPRRSFNGVARVTISDDKENNDVAPLPITLQPNEERIVPVNEASLPYGDWMLMVYDERQAVQLIRSAPFGQRPKQAEAAGQLANQPAEPNEPGQWRLVESPEEGNSSNGLPNVTGAFDATKVDNPTQSPLAATPINGLSNAAGEGAANPQTAPQPEIAPGQVVISPRQVAVTTENVTMELDIVSPRPLGYVKVSLRSGNYQDERAAVISTPNGRVPFLVPIKDATADFSYEMKDEAGRVLSSGVGNFRQLRQVN